MLNNVKFKVEYGAVPNENFTDSDAWTCTLSYCDREIEVPFYMGKGHLGEEPQLNDVLYSLFMDAMAVGMSFEDFCFEFGYDNDSIRAFKTYDACVKMGKELNYLLGEDYDAISDELEAVTS